MDMWNNSSSSRHFPDKTQLRFSNCSLGFVAFSSLNFYWFVFKVLRNNRNITLIVKDPNRLKPITQPICCSSKTHSFLVTVLNWTTKSHSHAICCPIAVCVFRKVWSKDGQTDITKIYTGIISGASQKTNFVFRHGGWKLSIFFKLQLKMARGRNRVRCKKCAVTFLRNLEQTNRFLNSSNIVFGLIIDNLHTFVSIVLVKKISIWKKLLIYFYLEIVQMKFLPRNWPKTVHRKQNCKWTKTFVFEDCSDWAKFFVVAHWANKDAATCK